MPQATVPSIGAVVGWVAKRGGYLGRDAGRPLGTQVPWDGMQRADDIIETVKIFRNVAQGP